MGGLLILLGFINRCCHGTFCHPSAGKPKNSHLPTTLISFAVSSYFNNEYSTKNGISYQNDHGLDPHFALQSV